MKTAIGEQVQDCSYNLQPTLRGRNTEMRRREDVARHLGYARAAAQGHRYSQLTLQYTQHIGCALLAPTRQPPDDRPAEQHSRGAEGKSLHHIRTPADPTIDQHVARGACDAAVAQ